LFIVFAAFFFACEDDTTVEPMIEQEPEPEPEAEPHPASLFNNFPYPFLKDYELFEGPIADLVVDETEVLPYELNTPLFSDYSQKFRFIYLPPDVQIEFSEQDFLDFPIGTVIGKTFFFWNDETDLSAGRRILETRLLVRLESEWEVFSYIWNDEQTQAEFKVVGKQVPISFVNAEGEIRTPLYLIPNKNECKNCHSQDDIIEPLGPKGRNLNRDYDFEAGTMNQLEKMASMNWFTSDINMGTPLPQWDNPSYSLNERARAYLDVNCAHCHNPVAAANTTGLFLNYLSEDMTLLGICKPPVAAGNGSGGLQFGIVPGNAEESIMTFRMNNNDLDIRMPELGRSIVHEEGFELITDWINQLESTLDCGG